MKPAVIRVAVQLVAAAAAGAVLTAVVYSQLVCAAAPQQLSLSPTDVGFAQDMSAHHQQAALMADMLTFDAAPELLALADQIRVTQIREIGIMMGWLQIAQAPLTSSSPMTWMSSDHHQHAAAGGTTMAGMASPDDLTRLQRATARDNEIMFLQFMIRHHQGGIDMASYVKKHTTIDAVRQTAVTMIDEQTQEVGLMMILLEQRNAVMLAYP